jgi:hypothetical protein
LLVSALVLSLLAQPKTTSSAPEIAVLVSRRIGVGEVRAQALARKVTEYLRSQGFEKVTDPAAAAKSLAVMGVKDTAECDGKRECVSGLGRVLRSWAVVALDLADVNDTMAMHFEALLSDSGEKVFALDMALPTKKAEVEMATKLGPLATALHEALDKVIPKDAQAEQQRAPPKDAPLAQKLEPTPPAQEVQESPPMPGAHVGALITTASAVVGAGLMVLFLAQGGGAQRQLDNARVDRPSGAMGYTLTETQARQLASRANDNYSAALGVGIGAAALAITSAILWAQK